MNQILEKLTLLPLIRIFTDALNVYFFHKEMLVLTIMYYFNLFLFVNKVIPLKAPVVSRKMEKYLSFRSNAKVFSR